MISILENNCDQIQKLFMSLTLSTGTLTKNYLVDSFREEHGGDKVLLQDLSFCFKVLAGKYKVGYTLYTTTLKAAYEADSIQDLYNKVLVTNDTSDDNVFCLMTKIPNSVQHFIVALFNREYKLGYSDKQNMIDNLSPMLAKRYPDTFETQTKYYVQEKLDGNRCIAYYDFANHCWAFQSRSGKPLKLNFDMSWAAKNLVFDGEVMTLAHAGSRDFNKTSGAINSKYGDKSGLHYFIYDIIDEYSTYESRLGLLQYIAEKGVSEDCTILKVLDTIELYSNPAYNCLLDTILDEITSKGGEGVILRKATGKYEHKRSNNLIKYKKTQTMDLRIIGWNEGQGKYEGMIGSFICEDDQHTIKVNVAGMSDAIRMSDPADWMNKIIEVAYFDISKSSQTNCLSLRFPRMKKVRDDKNETSTY